MLSLTKWEILFHMMLQTMVGKQLVFKRMLESCKYTKFCEINFKILAQVLLTPKILASMKSLPHLAFCPWCGDLGTLEHMLLTCILVSKAWKLLINRNKNLMLPWEMHNWIFGMKRNSLNPIVWVINFTIYKCYLHAINGYHDVLENMIQSECARYSTIFPILNKKWTLDYCRGSGHQYQSVWMRWDHWSFLQLKPGVTKTFQWKIWSFMKI